MASSKRLVPLVISCVILIVSTLWLSNTYLLNRVQHDNDNLPPVVASRLESFQLKRSIANIVEQNHDWSGSYQQHALCGGCYHAVVDREENIRCGLLIHQRMKEENGLDLLNAARFIATSDDYKSSCARCHPDACSVQEKVYWRYDAKHKIPAIVDSKVPNLVSVPAVHRIPAQAVHNLTAFFHKPGNAAPTARYLFEYNPSIVVLTPAMVMGLDLGINGDSRDTPSYVASFRVSTQQSCFHPHETLAMYAGSWDKKPPVQDYLALALLRADLSILQDVVVDIKSSGVFQSYAEDFRLFVLNGELYVASYDLIAPIRITFAVTTKTRDSSPDEYIQLKPIFPSSKMVVLIREVPSCPVCHNRPNKRCGKNFNYFSDTESTTATDRVALVEVWPTGPRIVQRVNLQQSCRNARQQATEQEIGLQTFSGADSSRQVSSWSTMEEVMFPEMKPSEAILSRGRGGACCIPMQHPQTGEDLLVGIYHQKFPKFGRRAGKKLPVWQRGKDGAISIAPNQYLSRWYTFLRAPPYQIVAQSGLFCLGFPDLFEQNAHYLVNTTLWKRMIFGGDGKVDKGNYSLFLDCPRIHFVSGITQKADDPSKVIVAYGVNDCFSRLIEIEHRSIVNALFPSAE